MTVAQREELLRAAAVMANGDMACNGQYLNAPYKIAFNGTVYIARIKMVERNGKTVPMIHVEQPVTYIGTEYLV